EDAELSAFQAATVESMARTLERAAEQHASRIPARDAAPVIRALVAATMALSRQWVDDPCPTESLDAFIGARLAPFLHAFDAILSAAGAEPVGELARPSRHV
ncbi:MAG: hypothetical protein QM655_11475, partial [Nocardioidaceae bacterium]